MDSELVSIIVPVYNVAPYLDRCLESIVSQTYTDMEIILVDDGSADGSGAMCDAWRERDSRISVLHQPNGGLSAARNAGICLARGAFFMFADSDDVVAPNIVAVLADVLKKENADLAVCDAAHFTEGDPISFDTQIRPVLRYGREQAIGLMWYQKTFLPGAWAKLYRRRLFDSLRFTEKILFEDIDLMHRILWECETVAYTPTKLYGYMHRAGSITTAAFSVRDCDILPIAEKILTFARDNAPALIPAAQAYAVTAAFRIFLNAPQEQCYLPYRDRAQEILAQYGKSVLHDPRSRTKTRCALFLYFYCRGALKTIYKRKNRWK